MALAAWRSAVGEPIQRVTRVEGLESGVLTVEVSDVAWGDSLRKLEKGILSRVRGPLGAEAPRRIEFRVSPDYWRPDRRPVPTIAREAHREARAEAGGDPRPAGGRPRGAVDGKLAPEDPGPGPMTEGDLAVADPVLRRTLCRVANLYLRRRELPRRGGEP